METDQHPAFFGNVFGRKTEAGTVSKWFARNGRKPTLGGDILRRKKGPETVFFEQNLVVVREVLKSATTAGPEKGTGGRDAGHADGSGGPIESEGVWFHGPKVHNVEGPHNAKQTQNQNLHHNGLRKTIWDLKKKAFEFF